MSLIAAVLEPAPGLYTSVLLEFRDRPAQRVVFGRLEQAVAFHERAERLTQAQADWATCLAAAQAQPGFVRASEG